MATGHWLSQSRVFLTMGLATLALLIACGGKVSGNDRLRAAVDNANYSLDQSTGIATGAVPGSQVVEAKLNAETTTPFYQVTVSVNGQVKEVVIDSKSGAVLAMQTTGAGLLASCPLSLSQAIGIAQGAVGGQATTAEIESACDFSLQVLKGMTLYEVHLSSSGQVLSVEAEEFEHDDD